MKISIISIDKKTPNNSKHNINVKIKGIYIMDANIYTYLRNLLFPLGIITKLTRIDAIEIKSCVIIAKLRRLNISYFGNK